MLWSKQNVDHNNKEDLKVKQPWRTFDESWLEGQLQLDLSIGGKHSEVMDHIEPNYMLQCSHVQHVLTTKHVKR